jgi:hypothetical protein
LPSSSLTLTSGNALVAGPFSAAPLLIENTLEWHGQ